MSMQRLLMITHAHDAQYIYTQVTRTVRFSVSLPCCSDSLQRRVLRLRVSGTAHHQGTAKCPRSQVGQYRSCVLREYQVRVFLRILGRASRLFRLESTAAAVATLRTLGAWRLGRGLQGTVCLRVCACACACVLSSNITG